MLSIKRSIPWRAFQGTLRSTLTMTADVACDFWVGEVLPLLPFHPRLSC